MNLSKKANSISPSITLEITGKANELKAQGVNVMSFAAGEPDFNTPKNIIEAVKRGAVRQPFNIWVGVIWNGIYGRTEGSC